MVLPGEGREGGKEGGEGERGGRGREEKERGEGGEGRRRREGGYLNTTITIFFWLLRSGVGKYTRAHSIVHEGYIN